MSRTISEVTIGSTKDLADRDTPSGCLIFGTTTWVGAAVPPSIPGCFPGPDVERVWTNLFYWIPVCVVDSIMFLLTAARAAQLWRASGGATPLLAIIIRDGTAYFAVRLKKLSITSAG